MKVNMPSPMDPMLKYHLPLKKLPGTRFQLEQATPLGRKKQLAVWKIDNRMELPISSAKKQNRISEPSTVG